MRSPQGLTVWAVEDDAAQLCWDHLPAGPWQFRCADTTVSVDSLGGPGAVRLTGLPSSTALQAHAHGPAGSRSATLRFTTLAPPPGQELARLATVSDLHFGRSSFGYLDGMTDRSGAPTEPGEYCTTAAATEAAAWGAQLLVVKGDISEHGFHHELEAAATSLATPGLPVWAMPGNHDMRRTRNALVTDVFRSKGLNATRSVGATDVAGLRVVLLDTTMADYDVGRYNHQEEALVEALAGTDHPALVCTHHHPMALPVPHFWPPGVPSFSTSRMLRAALSANRRLIFTSGHTHRNRMRSVDGVPWSEVGSPRDWPGVWAGYVVHEGGIRQVVHRVAAPDAIRWTTYTRGAVFGVWGRWAPGSLHQRCFTHTWPA